MFVKQVDKKVSEAASLSRSQLNPPLIEFDNFAFTVDNTELS